MDKKASFFKRRSDAEPQKEKENFSNDYTSEREDKPARRNRFDDDDEQPRQKGFVTRPKFDDERPDFSDRRDRADRGGRRGDRDERRERPDRRDDRNDRGERREYKGDAKKPFKQGEPILKVPENLIFGVHPVREAFGANRSVEKLYTVKRGNESLQEIEQLAVEAGVPVQYVPTEKLDYLSKRNNHQGVVAILSEIEYADITDVLDKKPTLIVVLDSVTDVRNFGAIARSAECAGVDAIVVSAKNSAPINGEAMKSSAGALSRIPVCKVGSLRNTLKTIQLSGIQLVAATEKTEDTLYDVDFVQPTAIVMGSEEKGISGDTLKLCDKRAMIPMVGSIESLNVSSAAAVMLYEAVRQRR